MSKRYNREQRLLRLLACGWVLFTASCLLLLGNSCKSGNGNPDNSNDPGKVDIPFPPDTQASGNADEAVLEGVIEVLDFLPFEDEPVSGGGGGEVSSLRGVSAGGFQIMGRIIQPGDDILSTIVTMSGQQYRLTLPRAQLGAKQSLSAALQVELRVNDDLNGDTVGGDTIIQTIPVTMALGVVSKLNLTISRGRPSGAVTPGAGAPNVSDEIAPPIGDLVYTAIEREDAAGFADNFYGTLPGTGQVVFDADGNGYLDPSDDRVLEDTDSNGWADPIEQVVFDPVAVETSLQGTIISIDLASYSFQFMSAGEPKTVFLDPFAYIQPINSEDDLLGAVIFDTSLIGSTVLVEGFEGGPDTIFANRVVVLELLGNGR